MTIQAQTLAQMVAQLPADQEVTLHSHPCGHHTIADLRFNRPARKNAMTFDMAAQFRTAVAAIKDSSDVAAVVISGEGGNFCSGAELGWLSAQGETTLPQLRQRMRWFYESFLSITELAVPIIAAVDGPAIGAGMAIAAAADLRVVGDAAKVGAPFSKLGIHPGMASSATLPQLLGHSMAADVLLTGRILTGAECVTTGFASRSCPAGQAHPTGLAVAEEICAAAPMATELTVRALRMGSADRVAAIHWESLAQPVTMLSADAAEGLAAKADRRTPQFAGL